MTNHLPASRFAALHQQLIAAHADPSILIDGDNAIVDRVGVLDRFLRVASTEPSPNLFATIHPGLKAALITACAATRQQGTPTVVPPLQVRLGQELQLVAMRVSPITQPAGSQGLLWVRFLDLGVAPNTAVAPVPTGAPHTLAGATPSATVSTSFEDSPERRRGEATLRDTARQAADSARVAKEHVARLESLLTYAPIGIALLDTDLRYRHVNARLAAMNGLPVEAHLGREIREVLPRFAPELEAIFTQVLANSMPLADFEITGETATTPGEQHTWLSSYFPVRDQDGVLLGTGVVVSDITARRQAEQALQSSQQNLLALIENTDGSIWSVDTQYRLIVGNSRFQQDVCAALGRDPRMGECLLTLPLPQELLDIWHAAYDRSLAGATFSLEVALRFSPEPRIMEYRLSPIRTGAGMVVGATVFGQEITERLRAEQALRDTERKLGTLFALLPIGISILDASGAVVYANPALEQIVQLSQAELTNGHHLQRHHLRPDGTLMPAEEFASTRVLREQQVVSEVETGIQLEPGAVRWTSVSAVPVDFPDWRAVVITTDVTARKQAEEVQHAFARRLVTAQEAERAHLARELHDEVGQMLTGLNIKLEAVRQQAADVPRTLAEAQTLVSELTDLVGRMSHTLQPRMLDDLGLLPTLQWYLDRYTAQTGIRVRFQHAGLDQRFDAPLAITAYRLVQEALTNVARHADVTSAAVTVWADPAWLTVQVEDAGRGFDAATLLANHRSSGLLGMRERVMLLNGDFHIDSAPGRGTRLYAALPLLQVTH